MMILYMWYIWYDVNRRRRLLERFCSTCESKSKSSDWLMNYFTCKKGGRENIYSNSKEKLWRTQCEHLMVCTNRMMHFSSKLYGPRSTAKKLDKNLELKFSSNIMYVIIKSMFQYLIEHVEAYIFCHLKINIRARWTYENRERITQKWNFCWMTAPT